jgi:hypothetical protein
VVVDGTADIDQLLMATAPLIVLVDWSAGGHNATHLTQFFCAVTEIGLDATIICDPIVAEQVRDRLTGAGKRVPKIYGVGVPTFVPNRPRALHLWLRKAFLQNRVRAAILAAEQEHGRRASLIFFSCLFEHGAAETLGVLGSLDRPCSTLYLHPRQFHSAVARPPEKVRDLHKLLTDPRMRAIATMNEDVADTISQRFAKPVVTFPEITDEEHDPNHPLKLRLRRFAGTSPLVVLAGYLGPWKGSYLLAKVSLMPEAADLCFAFVGMFSLEAFPPQEREILAECMNRTPNSLFHVARIPDGSCYNAVIDAADVVFCAFQNFQFSSNTQTKAAILERPIIVSEGYLMADRVRKYRLGEIIPEDDPHAALAAIRRITNDYSQWLSEKAPQWAEYRRMHSHETLKSAFRSLFTATGVSIPEEKAQLNEEVRI